MKTFFGEVLCIRFNNWCRCLELVIEVSIPESSENWKKRFKHPICCYYLYKEGIIATYCQVSFGSFTQNVGGPSLKRVRDFKGMFEDKVLVCGECGEEFIFSAGEQEFYSEKGFANEPKRCKGCRSARKVRMGEAQGSREMHEAVCADCGTNTTVPFRPVSNRPIYCQQCFAKNRV